MSNCDNISFYYVDFTQLPSVRYAFVVLYVIVILLSLFGNLLVISTIIRNRQMRTVTNFYILNLATCDFLVAVFVVPLKLLEYTAPCNWYVLDSDSLCAILYYLLPVFVFASVLTLVAISIERYYAVVHPINAKIFLSKSRTRKIILTIWIVAIVVASPYLFCKNYSFNITSDLGSVSRYTCTDRFDDIDEFLFNLRGADNSTSPPSGRFRKGFFLFLFSAMYVLPSAVILFSCVSIVVILSRPVKMDQQIPCLQRVLDNKRKISRMVIVIAITFLLSWSPFYLVSFISQVQSDSFLKQSNYLFTMLTTHLIGFTNSSINPFVYTMLGDRFRSSFKVIVLDICRLLCSRKVTRRLSHWLQTDDSYRPREFGRMGSNLSMLSTFVTARGDSTYCSTEASARTPSFLRRMMKSRPTADKENDHQRCATDTTSLNNGLAAGGHAVTVGDNKVKLLQNSDNVLSTVNRQTTGLYLRNSSNDKDCKWNVLYCKRGHASWPDGRSQRDIKYREKTREFCPKNWSSDGGRIFRGSQQRFA